MVEQTPSIRLSCLGHSYSENGKHQSEQRGVDSADG
jgi:hypothetical protein